MLQSGESTDTAWKRCADDYNCSSGCVQVNILFDFMIVSGDLYPSHIVLQAYVNRYKSKCTNKGTCEQMSRIHNGGQFFLTWFHLRRSTRLDNILPFVLFVQRDRKFLNPRKNHWSRLTATRFRTERMQCFRHEFLLECNQIVLRLLVIYPFHRANEEYWCH